MRAVCVCMLHGYVVASMLANGILRVFCCFCTVYDHHSIALCRCMTKDQRMSITKSESYETGNLAFVNCWNR